MNEQDPPNAVVGQILTLDRAVGNLIDQRTQRGQPCVDRFDARIGVLGGESELTTMNDVGSEVPERRVQDSTVRSEADIEIPVPWQNQNGARLGLGEVACR